MQQQRASSDGTIPSEILPTTGFVFQEVEEQEGLLCPPKLLPIKSFALERLERLEKHAAEEAKAKRLGRQQQRAVPQWNTTQQNTTPEISTPAPSAEV
ncbi:putative Cilia BBSome complex subunit 10 [Trypanosoma vivax]|nr:putative Cilia BBSome complex subunit 10 [Trypanosoma vivax]